MQYFDLKPEEKISNQGLGNKFKNNCMKNVPGLSLDAVPGARHRSQGPENED